MQQKKNARYNAVLVLGWILLTGLLWPAAAAQRVDFESLDAGTSVEGLGAVHPDLHITTSQGKAIVIEEGLDPTSYRAPNGSEKGPNGCLGTPGGGSVVMGGGKGIGDPSRQHDYVFTFGPNRTVSEFSIRMLDYGDLNPYYATEHRVKLVAFDDANHIVDEDIFAYTSEKAINPKSGSAGNLWLTGDACTAAAGEPGNVTFTVSGRGIARVALQYANNSLKRPLATSDPLIGFDDIAFALEPVTSTVVLDLLPGRQYFRNGTIITDEYIDAGVLFSTDSSDLPVAFRKAVLGGDNRIQNRSFYNLFRAHFVTEEPVVEVSIVLSDHNIHHQTHTLTAFDRNGQVIDQDQFTDGGLFRSRFILRVSSPVGIDSIVAIDQRFGAEKLHLLQYKTDSSAR